MVIALNEVADENFWSRLAILAVVAVAITVLVYGVVSIIVKMDDIGLSLAQRKSAASQRFGLALVRAMPKVLAAISAVGIVAMLWVGGHILLVGVDDLGWHWPYEQVHDLEHNVHDALDAFGAIGGWLTNTALSAVVGAIVGAVVVAIMHVIPRRRARTLTVTVTS